MGHRDVRSHYRLVLISRAIKADILLAPAPAEFFCILHGGDRCLYSPVSALQNRRSWERDDVSTVRSQRAWRGAAWAVFRAAGASGSVSVGPR